MDIRLFLKRKNTNEAKEAENVKATRTEEPKSTDTPENALNEPSNSSLTQPIDQSTCHQTLSLADHETLVQECFSDISNKKLHNHMICMKKGCTHVPINDKFNHSWLDNKALSFCKKTGLWIFVYNENDGLYCMLCKKHSTKNVRNKSSVFAEEASKRLRRCTLSDHTVTQRHKDAIEAELLNRTSLFQHEIDQNKSVKNEVLYQCFYCFYFLAKEMISNRKVHNFLKLIEHIGLKQLKYFKHRSNRVSRDILLTLSETIQNNIVKKIERASGFGIMVDDMSDVSVMEQMIVYIQYVNPDTADISTDFLSIKNLLENSVTANSETLLNSIVTMLTELNLDENKVVGLCTDGASVMTGKKNGLSAKLRNICPSLVAVHCICHRLALACADTNSTLKSISNVEQICLQLWKLFHFSPKKMAAYLEHLKSYRNVTLSGSSMTKVGKVLKRACKTRWLSFDASIQALFEEFIPTLQTLNSLSETDATAFGLLKKMKCAQFIGIIYILHEVLPVLAKVSKLFQRGHVSFSSIAPTLDCAKHDLQNIVQQQTPIKLLEKDISSDGRLQLLELHLADGTRDKLQSTLTNYITALLNNLDNRFPQISVLEAVSVFDISKLPEDGLDKYGENSISVLYRQFFAHDDSVSENQCLAEWNLLKYHLKKWKADLPCVSELTKQMLTSTDWCLRNLISKEADMQHIFPVLIKIVENILCIPVSNAWPERGASKVKLVKTDLRNRLKNDMLNGLLHITINGPESCSDQADKLIEEAVSTWLEQPRRRIPKLSEKGRECKSQELVDAGSQTETEIETISTETTSTEPCPNRDDEDKEEAAVRQFEQNLLQLKLCRSVQEARQFNDVSDSESDSDSLSDHH